MRLSRRIHEEGENDLPVPGPGGRDEGEALRHPGCLQREPDVLAAALQERNREELEVSTPPSSRGVSLPELFYITFLSLNPSSHGTMELLSLTLISALKRNIFLVEPGRKRAKD
jgi:hypothetical protein